MVVLPTCKGGALNTYSILYYCLVSFYYTFQLLFGAKKVFFLLVIRRSFVTKCLMSMLCLFVNTYTYLTLALAPTFSYASSAPGHVL